MMMARDRFVVLRSAFRAAGLCAFAGFGLWVNRTFPAGQTPGSVQDHHMYFDTRAQAVRLVGGWNGRSLSNLWQHDGDHWTIVSADAPARSNAADLDQFVGLFEADSRAADIDGSGFVDGFDYDWFVTIFEAGCD